MPGRHLVISSGGQYARPARFLPAKSERIIVEAPAGGGFVRPIGKHIPGNPTFIVENMPDADFLISANQYV